MTAALLLLAATLTRAEFVERFRAAPATMCDGLVQVWAHCPKDMRREYQLPVATFAGDVCRALYGARGIRPRRFERPGVVITIGDTVTNDATVAVRDCARDDGAKYVRVWVPAPGYADTDRLRLAVARGWFLAVEGRDPGETVARETLIDADPELRVAAEVGDLVRWRTGGVYTRGRTDEDYLKLQRKVLRPGCATREEVLVFASRLALYPACWDAPFRGRYHCLDFRDAVHLAKDDLLVRLAARKKADELLVWGGGRGETMAAAATLYSDFLRALARGDTDMTRLDRLLDAADEKLKEALP